MNDGIREEKKHIVKLCDGPFDGVQFDCVNWIDKIVLQMVDGKTYRYECDVIEGDNDRVMEHRMVLTQMPREFDEELKQDEI